MTSSTARCSQPRGAVLAVLQRSASALGSAVTFVLTSALTVVLLGACAEAPSPAPASDPVPFSVYSVNYPLAYFAERIGGDHVDVTFPVPPDVDPAFWQPSPEIVAEYQRAQLVLLNGAGFAKWIDTAPLPSSRLLNTGALTSGQFISIENTVQHSHGSKGDHSHGELAFTTWLDLDLAAGQVRAIDAALARALPHHAPAFAEQTSALLDDLAALDERLLALGDKPPMLASHPVYQYLARRYDLDLRALHWEPDLAPDDESWATLDAMLAEQGALWMLWEAQPLASVVTELQRRGLTVLVIDPCGNRPSSGDFLTVMQDNVAKLAQACGS